MTAAPRQRSGTVHTLVASGITAAWLYAAAAVLGPAPFTESARPVHTPFTAGEHDRLMTHPEPASRPAPGPPRMLLPALLLTTLLPGAGHALLRDWARAVLWTVGWVVVGTAGGGHSVPLMVLIVIATIDVWIRARQFVAAEPRAT